MSGRVLTRDQVLSWNTDWSFTDRQAIASHLSRLGAHTFYVPPSGGYIGCVDAQGTRVMFINPGYVTFKSDLAPDDLPDPNWPGFALSTFRPHASPTAEPSEGHQTCPVHNITLPVNGVCDDCQ